MLTKTVCRETHVYEMLDAIKLQFLPMIFCLCKLQIQWAQNGKHSNGHKSIKGRNSNNVGESSPGSLFACVVILGFRSLNQKKLG